MEAVDVSHRAEALVQQLLALLPCSAVGDQYELEPLYAPGDPVDLHKLASSLVHLCAVLETVF